MRPSHRHLATTLALLTTASILAACSTSGTAVPSPTSAGAADGIDPALRVPRPLPTEELLKTPCALFSPAQAATLSIKLPGRLDTRFANACNWTSASTPLNGVGIGALPQNSRGITDIYAGKPQSAYFEPTTVNGYPGVYTAVSDDRKDGACQLWVGVTDQLAVSVVGDIGAGEYKTNPCPIALRFGTALIDHLQGKA